MGDAIRSVRNGRNIKQDKSGKGTPVSRIETIAQEEINFDRVGYTKDDVDPERDLLTQGDLLFSHINSATHLGKTAVFRSERPLFHGINLLRIQVERQAVDPEFFHQQCCFMRQTGVFELNGQHAVNQSSINQKKLKELPFVIPPLPEQRRIVGKLDTLGARTNTTRTNLSAIAKLVERYKHSVLGQIFDNLDRPTDELRSLTSLVTSGSRGWAKYYADDGPLFIRVGDTRRGTPILDLSDAQHVRPPADGEGKRTKLRAGDLVVSITADLGRVGVVPEGVEEAYVNQHIALVRPNDAGSSQFIAWYLISPPGQTQLFENDRGATKAGLGLEDIRNVQIPRCTSDEQREIVRRIETAFAKIDLLAAEAEKALKLTDRMDQRILAKAFAGELVPQDPTDEPASVLLERIRAEQASAPKRRRGRKKKADA